MDKTAQKMRLSKWREKLSPSGHLEEFFQPQFKEVMNNLRKGDDNIRSIVAGEKLGDGEPGKHAISLKELLARAKTNFNRREYMSAISDFSRFHDKLREIVAVLNQLNLNVDKVHHQFLFQDLDEEHKPHLMDLENRWKAASDARQVQLRKEAGVMDIWHNLTNERGIALRKWEKQYPKKTEDLKRALIALQQEGEKTKTAILDTLKDLAHLRATRKPEEYMKLATSKSGIMGAYNSFDKLFQKVYASTIQKFISDMKNFQASQPAPDKEKKETPASPEKMKIKTNIGPDITSDVTVPPPGKVPSLPPVEPKTIPVGPPKDMVDPHAEMEQYINWERERQKANAPKPVDSTTDVLNRLPPLEPSVRPNARVNDTIPAGPPSVAPSSPGSGVVPKGNPPSVPAKTPAQVREEIEKQHGFAPLSSHTSFYASLEKMAGEDPLVLASFISRYAKKIQATDPATSIQLLNVVKRIKG